MICLYRLCRKLLPLFLASVVLVLLLGCGRENPWQLEPFRKFGENPILLPRGQTWEAKDIFNPAAWANQDSVWLLYRAEDSSGIGQWNGTSRIGLASSADGYRFHRDARPVLVPTESWEQPGGCEDPRVVKIRDTFYLTYTAYDGQTARLALATSPDLRHWEKQGLVFPNRGWTKSGAILDRPVNGRYWMYFGDTDIRAAWSEDLRHWTVAEEPVLRPRHGQFDSRLVEPGPPPVMTESGILLMYNGANDSLVYTSGQALLDPGDPTRVMARSQRPFLRPESQLERHGQVPQVVFIEGLVHFRAQWFLYFGMGDSGIGVATHQPG